MSACASTNTQQTKCNLLKLPCNSYEVFQKYLPRRKLLLDAVTANEVNLFSYVYIRDIFQSFHLDSTKKTNQFIFDRNWPEIVQKIQSVFVHAIVLEQLM